MRDIERRKLDKFERQMAFFADNAADFPTGTPGGTVAEVNAQIVAEMQALAGEQFSENASSLQSFQDKDDLFDDLKVLLKNMNRAANAFEDEVPGADQMFRMPRNHSNTSFMAAARAFLSDAEAFKDKFVEYGMASSFLADLQGLIDDIEASGQAGDSSIEQRAASTTGLMDAAKRGMDNSRRADAIVRIKYTDNPQKLASWTVASHLERPPKKAEPTT